MSRPTIAPFVLAALLCLSPPGPVAAEAAPDRTWRDYIALLREQLAARARFRGGSLYDALAADAAATLGRGMDLLADELASGLAAWIRRSREAAISGGVQPIPPEIRQKLTGFFDPDVLARVRYRAAPTADFMLSNLSFRLGDAAAITLADVVVFRTAAGAQDLALWAHELTHVEQFRRWGVDYFSARYVEDREAVEAEARDRAVRFLTWRDTRPSVLSAKR